MSEEKWFAVYTRPGWERKVAESLAKKGIEHYCPLNREPGNQNERKKTVDKPLFASYVFVNPGVHEASSILRIDGVINFLYWLNRPAVIRQEEIFIIKKLLSQYAHLTVIRNGFISQHDEITVDNDPLIMRKGNILEVMNKTVRVTLPSLGHTLIAEVKKEYSQQFAPVTGMAVGADAGFPTV